MWHDATTYAWLAQASAPTDLLDWILRGGLPAFLLVFLLGLAKKEPWFVTGTHYREMRSERDTWQKIAIKVLSATERAADATDRVADAVGEPVTKQVQLTEALIRLLKERDGL